MNMICTKCHNRGVLYQIDGSVTSVKSCDCEVAKEQNDKFHSWAANFRKGLNEALKKVNV